MAENQQHCVGDDLLWRYIEGATDKEETRTVRAHLIRCEACFGVFVSVLHTEKHGLSQEVLVRVSELLSRDREQVIADFLQKNAGVQGQRMQRQSLWQNLKYWLGQTVFARPALGIAATLLLALAVWQGISHLSQPGESLYVYDERAPYLPSTLRTAAPESEATGWQQKLKNAIQNRYALREYESALTSFEQIEPVIASLPPDSITDAMRSRLRDVHFYKGLSHLALSRSQTRALPDSERVFHAESAIRSLTIADSLVKAHGMPDADREVFYLGLALALHGNKQEALARLDKITNSSNFFEECQRLKKSWLDE